MQQRATLAGYIVERMIRGVAKVRAMTKRQDQKQQFANDHIARRAGLPA
jgi:hypothetical protein